MDLAVWPPYKIFQVDLARADGATPLFKACHKVGSTIYRSHHYHHLHHRHHGPSSYVTEQFKLAIKARSTILTPGPWVIFNFCFPLSFLLITAQPQHLPHIQQSLLSLRATMKLSGSSWSTIPSWATSPTGPLPSMPRLSLAITRYI